MERNQRTATYEIYKVAHQQFHLGNMSLKRCTTVIGSMIADTPSGWRVIGITHAALEKIASEDFRRVPRGVQRAHLFERIETIRMLLEDDTPLREEQVFEIWNKRDKTVLGLSSENKRISETPYYEINNPVGEFFPNNYIGYRFTQRREGAFLRNLWSTISTG